MPSNTPEKAREYYINYKNTLQERNKIKKHCHCCDTDITPWNWNKHTKTKIHIKKLGQLLPTIENTEIDEETIEQQNI
jgi:hypothetical protein